MSAVPLAADPLRSGRGIFELQSYSALRSPMPKATMGAVLQPIITSPSESSRPAPGGEGDHQVHEDFQRLCQSSPVPKVVMDRLQPQTMPPPPPLQPVLHIDLRPPGAAEAPMPSEKGGLRGLDAASIAPSTASSGSEGTSEPAMGKAANGHAPPRQRPTGGESASDGDAVQSGAKAPAAPKPLQSKGGDAPKAKPTSKERPAVTLQGWYLKRLGKNGDGEYMLGVEGKRTDLAAGSSINKPWHSSTIVERVDSHTVRTASGSTYQLRGQISTAANTNVGLPASLVAAFTNGFPDDWKAQLRPDRSPPPKKAERRPSGPAEMADDDDDDVEEEEEEEGEDDPQTASEARAVEARLEARLQTKQLAARHAAQVGRQAAPAAEQAEPEDEADEEGQAGVTGDDGTLVGRRVQQKFVGFGTHAGKVEQQQADGRFVVRFEDGEERVYTRAKLRPMLLPEQEAAAPPAEAAGFDDDAAAPAEEPVPPAAPPNPPAPVKEGARGRKQASARRARGGGRQPKAAPAEAAVEEQEQEAEVAAEAAEAEAEPASSSAAEPAASSGEAAEAAAPRAKKGGRRGKGAADTEAATAAATPSPAAPARGRKAKAQAPDASVGSTPRETPRAAGAAAAAATPASRSRSGRLSVRPLAFWANQVIPRSSDGAYVAADGEEVQIEVRSVGDFTGSFKNERGASPAVPPPSKELKRGQSGGGGGSGKKKARRAGGGPRRRIAEEEEAEEGEDEVLVEELPPEAVTVEGEEEGGAAADPKEGKRRGAAGSPAGKGGKAKKARAAEPSEPAPEPAAPTPPWKPAARVASRRAADADSDEDEDEEAPASPGGADATALGEYAAREKQTPKAVAALLGLPLERLLALNAERWPKLKPTSRLPKDARLLVPAALVPAADAPPPASPAPAEKEAAPSGTGRQHGRGAARGSPAAEEPIAKRGLRRREAAAEAAPREEEEEEEGEEEAAEAEAEEQKEAPGPRPARAARTRPVEAFVAGSDNSILPGAAPPASKPPAAARAKGRKAVEEGAPASPGSPAAAPAPRRKAAKGGSAAGGGGAEQGGGGGGRPWDATELKVLAEAHARTVPDQPHFWSQVAAALPGRSEHECSERFYLQHPTPSRAKRKRGGKACRRTAQTPDPRVVSRRELPSHAFWPRVSGQPDEAAAAGHGGGALSLTAAALLQTSPWREAEAGEEQEDEAGILRGLTAETRDQVSAYASKVKQKKLKGGGAGGGGGGGGGGKPRTRARHPAAKPAGASDVPPPRPSSPAPTEVVESDDESEKDHYFE